MATIAEDLERNERLSGIGCSRKRKEDPRFIQGKGNYVDDVQLPGMLHGDFVRSPHAHARIKSINTAKALALPGVHAVLTADDLRPLDLHWMPTLAGDKQMVLADGKVCFQNQEVAMVIADNRYITDDAIALVEVEYEELPVVVDPHQSMAVDAPVIRDDLDGKMEGAHGKRDHHNHIFTWDVGDKAATDKIFNEAPVTVSQQMLYPRVHPCPLETCGCVSSFDKIKGELTVYVTSQAPHVVRTVFSMLSGIPESKVHIIAPDIGGGFGNKVGIYSGYVVATVASIVLGRPVKWVEDRIENLTTTAFARDYHMHGELAATADGRILALRTNVLADHGAFDACADPSKWPAGFFNICTGSYDIKTAYASVVGVYTNKAPGGVSYRCSFRVTEACYLIERMIDVLAMKLGMDKAEIRLKNFIQPEQFPYQSALGWEYDSGDYPRALKQVMEACDYAGLRREQKERWEQHGEIMGIGLCTFTEIVGAGPGRNCDILGVGMFDSAEIRVHPTGSIIARMGTKSQGQGHETTYAQIIATELGLSSDDIQIEEGDTDTAPYGLGTYGSRSTPVGGAATARAARKIRDKAKKIAAHLMEASEEDMEWTGEGFRVKGVPDQVTGMATIAWAAYNNTPDGMEPGLEAVDYYDPPNMTYPFGAYLCVLDIDRYTGETKVRRFYALDDCGTRINPMIIEGQVHGGLTEAFAVAMGQELPFDGAGNVQGGSLMDYFLPTMVETPHWELDHTVTPSPHHPLGAKGVGESAHVGGIPCFSNAINDAMGLFGVTHVDMPHNAYRTWKTLHELKLDQHPEAANVVPFKPRERKQPAAAAPSSAAINTPGKRAAKGTEVTLDRNYPLDVPAADAWKVLQDIHQVAACMPGASITEQTGENTYVGEMRMKVGPVTSSFKGDIEMLGLDAERHELRMAGRGGDTKGSSSASMTLTARIEDTGNGHCQLVGNTHIELKGKLASFGGRMMENVSDRMLQQFVDSFRDRVAAQGEGAEAEEARQRVAQGPKEMNALAVLWQLIKGLFGRK